MTAVTAAAASFALRNAPTGTVAVAETHHGPRFPNGYIPIDPGSVGHLRPTNPGPAPLTGPVAANRWWDSQVRVGRLDPRLVDRFVATVDAVTLPGPPESCIGWGPGLTPAADDVVVGMLATFHAVGARERVSALASACSGVETAPFSRSLIDHAVHGRAAKPVLDLLAALCGLFPLDPAVGALRRFGSTSGRHLLDGVSRALVEAERTTEVP